MVIGLFIRSSEYSCQFGNISLQEHCLITNFNFFSSQRNKKCFNCGGRVCLSLRKRRSQEKRKRGGGGKVAVARAVDDAHHFTLHFYYKY